MRKKLTFCEQLEKEALEVKTQVNNDQEKFMERMTGRDIIYVGYMFGKAFSLKEPYMRIKELGYGW